MNSRPIVTELAPGQRLYLSPETSDMPKIVLAFSQFNNEIPLNLAINNSFDRESGTNVYAIAMEKKGVFAEHTAYIRSAKQGNLQKIIYGSGPHADFFHARLNKTTEGKFDGHSLDLGGMTEDQYGNTIRKFGDALEKIITIPEYGSLLANISLNVTKWLSAAELSIYTGGKTAHIDLTLPQAQISVISDKKEVGEFIYPADTTTVR